MAAVLAFLAALDPKIFYLLLAGTVWVLLYLWRRISIASWDFVTRKRLAIQQLPGLLLAALLSAAPVFGKGMVEVVQHVILGVVFGYFPALGAHYGMKAAPIPYNGGKPRVDADGDGVQDPAAKV